MDLSNEVMGAAGVVFSALATVAGTAWAALAGRIKEVEKEADSSVGKASEHLTKELTRIETETDQGFRDVWAAITTEREESSRFRTAITGTVMSLPTRDENAQSFARLENLIREIDRKNK